MDLAEIAGKILVGREDEADRRGIQVTAALSAAPASGDPALAESLVANLVDNAIRHNHPHGQVEISTGLTPAGAALSVANTGTVIPPVEVDRLFEPFQQFGEERVRCGEGYGLGLAIAAAIATAHHAQLTAHSRLKAA